MNRSSNPTNPTAPALSAPPASSFAICLFKWLCGLWLGAMLFFTTAVTPAVFLSFSKHESGRIVAALFPNYYLACHLAFALAFLSGLPAALSRRVRGAAAALALLTLAWSLGPALNQFWLAPFLRELKAAGATAAFGRWHGISMLLNILAILLVAAAPWLPRPAPPTAGSPLPPDAPPA